MANNKPIAVPVIASDISSLSEEVPVRSSCSSPQIPWSPIVAIVDLPALSVSVASEPTSKLGVYLNTRGPRSLGLERCNDVV